MNENQEKWGKEKKNWVSKLDYYFLLCYKVTHKINFIQMIDHNIMLKMSYITWIILIGMHSLIYNKNLQALCSVNKMYKSFIAMISW